MRFTVAASCLVACLLAAAAPAAEPALDQLLADLRAVGLEGNGQGPAAASWAKVAQCQAAELPAVLAALDGASPLATNWIVTAAQTIAERHPGNLPLDSLERFIRDRAHGPVGRRLAFEILREADASAAAALVPEFLDDPASELRREAVARLLDLGEAASEPDAAKVQYRAALGAARDPDQVRTLADRLRKLGEPVDIPRQLGFVVRWQVIGPFDNTGRAGFDKVYPPEEEIRLDAAYPGKEGEVRWQELESADDWGKIDLFKPFGHQREVVGYAATTFVSTEQRAVELRMSSFNALKLWLNGRLVNAYPIYHSGSELDQYINRVTLEPGANVILVKVCQNEQTQDWAQRWDFQFRVCDPTGAALLSADREKAASK